MTAYKITNNQSEKMFIQLRSHLQVLGPKEEKLEGEESKQMITNQRNLNQTSQFST